LTGAGPSSWSGPAHTPPTWPPIFSTPYLDLFDNPALVTSPKPCPNAYSLHMNVLTKSYLLQLTCLDRHHMRRSRSEHIILFGQLIRGWWDPRGPGGARTDPVGRGPYLDPDDAGEPDGDLVLGGSGGLVLTERCSFVVIKFSLIFEIRRK
jgi:hypothetical protein